MKRLFFLGISLALLSGCNSNNKEIKVYEIVHHNKPSAKSEMTTHNPHDGHDHSHDQHKPAKSNSSGLSWTAPKGWVEEAGKSMRLVTFRISDHSECSFIILGGAAGGLESNVNRWRGQIGLSPIGEEAILKMAQNIKTPINDAQMFKLKNPNNKDSAFLVSIIPLNGKTLFVKLNSPFDKIDSLENDYKNLLLSIKNKG